MTVDVQQLLETMPSASSPEWSDAQIGRYRFLRLVGSGGMGVVVAAHDPELDREVAIKIVVTGDTDDARAVREAQAMARLSHPNVVQVYEVIRLGTRTAIVMELVEGPDLGVWQSEPHAWREIVDVYVQASRGLAAAHRAGIVHRDFKPANVVIDRHGVVRVTDFGVARRASPGAATPLDGRTGIAGTPVYMAPEQHRGDAVDARTDQWGLACSLYEALYGRRPFASAEASDLAAAVTRGVIDDDPRDSPVPRRIRAAIRRALSVSPADRFPSIDDFAAVLAATPRRTTPVIVVACAIALSALSVLAVVSRRTTNHARCEGLAAPMHELWTDATRTSLRTRLADPLVGVPEPSISTTLAGLDAYANRWGEARTQVCLDTQRGARSTGALDTFMRCLDRRLAGMRGLLEALDGADAATLRGANDAVVQLPPIDACAHDDDLDPRPATPELRAELDAAEGALAKATAMLSVSQFERALPLVAQAIAVGERASAPTTVARGLVIRGECQERMGRSLEALGSYRDAAHSAARARDHRTVANALTRAFWVEAYRLGRRSEVLPARAYVDLAVESAGRSDDVLAQWKHFLAILLYEDPRHVDEAFSLETEALEIRRRTLPASHLYILDSMETLGNIEAQRKNFDAAKRLLEQVLAARIAARGERDYLVSSALNNLGIIEYERGDLVADIGYLERAVETAAASGQPNINAEFNLAIAQLEVGRWRDAAATFASSLDRSTRLLGKDSADAAEAKFYLGITWALQGDVTRGRPMLLEGIEQARRAGSPAFASGLVHAARLALRDGDRSRAREHLAASETIPMPRAALRTLVQAELQRAERGCAVAGPALARALAEASSKRDRMAMSLATLGVAECEIETGAVDAARERLEAELAWLQQAGADDLAIAPVRGALARARPAR